MIKTSLRRTKLLKGPNGESERTDFTDAISNDNIYSGL